MEEKFKSNMTELETRLASGHRELEASLESEIRRNGTKLEDMDDRYARTEEALRRAEERVGEVQEEVRIFGHMLMSGACTELSNTRLFQESGADLQLSRCAILTGLARFDPLLLRAFLPRPIASVVVSNRCMR